MLPAATELPHESNGFAPAGPLHSRSCQTSLGSLDLDHCCRWGVFAHRCDGWGCNFVAHQRSRSCRHHFPLVCLQLPEGGRPRLGLIQPQPPLAIAGRRRVGPPRYRQWRADHNQESCGNPRLPIPPTAPLTNSGSCLGVSSNRARSQECRELLRRSGRTRGDAQRLQYVHRG